MYEKIEKKYERGIRRLGTLRRKLERIFTILSILRFLTFLSIFLLPTILTMTGLVPFSTANALLYSLPGLLLFLVLFFKHSAVSDRLGLARYQSREYENCLDRLASDWSERLSSDPAGASSAKESAPAEHAYQADLDIFGKFSLFQYLDRTSTPFGRRELKRLLLGQPDDQARDPFAYGQRKEAVKEFARMSLFRRRFRRVGMKLRMDGEDFDPLSWMEVLSKIEIPAYMKHLRIPAALLSLVTIGSYILFTMEYSRAFFMLTIPLQVLIFIWSHFQAKSISKRTADVAGHLTVFEKLTQVCADRTPGTEWTASMSLFRENPHRRLKELARIAGFFGLRQNPFAHGIMGIFCSYEIHLMGAFSLWLEKNRARLPEWLDELARLDALLCLAEFRADHPTFCDPELIQETPGDQSDNSRTYFDARGLAHPLLPARERVPNDVFFAEPRKLWLLTGSNMSGKSTLLRTAGVNLILAMLGASVCATSFRFRPLRIRTSMRQSDDLSRSVSLFYGEVRRIKSVLADTEQIDPVPLLFLIDEMLRGTNARERQIASRGIVRRLLDQGAVGMLTTHDMELLDLCESSLEVFCCHFEEIIEGNRMSFDYKLKDGPVKTSNALKILEMEGINISG